MTFEQVEELLQDLRRAQQRAMDIQERIDVNKSYRSSLSVSDSGNSSAKNTKSPVEKIAMRIDKEVGDLIMELEEVFYIEDLFTTACNKLAPPERDVLLGFYLDAKPYWMLCEKLGYCDRQLKRIRKKAIEKISKFL